MKTEKLFFIGIFIFLFLFGFVALFFTKKLSTSKHKWFIINLKLGGLILMLASILFLALLI